MYRRRPGVRPAVDVAIVLEHPGELGAAIRRAGHLPFELTDQQRVQADRAVFGQDAEQQQPHLIDDRLAPQQAEQPEREEPAVGAFQRLIDIGNGDRARDGPAVDLGTHRASRIEDLAQLRRQAAEFRGGRRNEAPVARPGATVDFTQAFDLPLELTELQRPDDDAMLSFRRAASITIAGSMARPRS